MTQARVPTVAVIGRQNVGKSTLINRLVGGREAIAHGSAGVTRDRVEMPVTWRGRSLALVDTAGFRSGAKGVEALAARQADKATVAADLVLLIVDARAGITEEDASLARRLRRVTVPVILVANKVDTAADVPDAAVFFSLGLGDPIVVSGLHGRSTGDLLDRVVSLLPDAPAESDSSSQPIPRFAIVGRPNVGKSTLFNALVGEDRSVVYEEAGTTRDPVDALVTWPSGQVRFVDTAGLRREIKVRGVEYFSLVRTAEAIARSDVAVLVIDAGEGLTGEDKKIANRVIDAGRALLLVANKWDLVTEKERAFHDLQEAATPYARATAVRTSAIRGQGVVRLPHLLTDLHVRWSRRIPTAKVNDVIQRAQAETPAPRAAGRVMYATQVDAGPPSFVLFGMSAPEAGYRRFLENRLRREFGYEGVPLQLRFRARKPRG
jgi:GTP-binding protein